ncbi:MAG: RNA 2',3'-cyclic phosphodiesterase [Acidobacteriota bacterium]
MPQTLRLFTGLALEYHLRRNLDLMLEHLRPLAPLHWSPIDKFHITTKFIGPWPAERLDELKAALAALEPRGPIITPISGFGWFPNPHHPRVLFAGVQAPPSLFDLAARLDASCARLGLAPDPRAYRPHLTLARVRGSVDLAPLRHAIAQLPSADFGVSSAARLLLYKSEPGEHTSIYTVIGDYPL